MNTKRTLLFFILIVAIPIAGCASKNGKVITPQPLTPEQRLAIAKIGTQTGVAALEIRIGTLEKNPEQNAQKIKILKAAKGILEEFNAQIADVTVIDLSNRETVRKAIDKGLKAADNLTNKDLLEIKDPKVQAEIRAGVGIARTALQSFDTLFPAQ